MPLETFSRPLVKQVIFQIKFPNLFYLESRIGDFQFQIMAQFPKSSMSIKRQVVLVDRGDQQVVEPPPAELRNEAVVKRIWNFESDQGVKIEVTTDSLTLISEKHKSYNNPDAAYRFRDAISFACGKFLAIVRVPVIARIGLRYIDECPVPGTTSDEFAEWYDSILPLIRFPLEQTVSANVAALVSRDPYRLRYVESLRVEQENRVLTLDFDASGENIDSARVLEVADALHAIIESEFDRTIKEPVKRYMRQPPEPQHVARNA